MVSDNGEEAKIVRYSGSTEKQIIQWDEQGHPLYSNRQFFKYLCENGNLDICLADNGANAVVVVSAVGKFRFRYTGNQPEESFYPYGITTDSQNRILIADKIKDNIHLVHQDGHLLGLIDNYDLQSPRCVCVDSKGNLFVAEQYTRKVKKIQYYQ
uniref:B-box type zinc finger protein ncl-1-like n=1 Tax=Crassostrea virginica TaxID=6565 RepID=A0A8B8E9J9_CRAVI|nr:B-box type zinc finger protein ncl-1-like [Crassostrea virginica]